MSIRQNIDAKALGKRYGEIVRDRKLPVQGVWVREDEEHPEIWVVTHSLELEEMRPVYESRIALRQHYPDAEYLIHTVNPAWIPDFSLADHLPADAQKIETGG